MKREVKGIQEVSYHLSSDEVRKAIIEYVDGRAAEDTKDIACPSEDAEVFVMGKNTIPEATVTSRFVQN